MAPTHKLDSIEQPWAHDSYETAMLAQIQESQNLPTVNSGTVSCARPESNFPRSSTLSSSYRISGPSSNLQKRHNWTSINNSPPRPEATGPTGHTSMAAPPSTVRPTMEREFSTSRRIQPVQPSRAIEWDSVEARNEPKMVILSTDFGTTFTSLAYCIHPLDEENLRASPYDINNISNWPNTADPTGAAAKQIPSEVWYSSIPIDRSAPQKELPEGNLYDSEEEDDNDMRSSTLHPSDSRNFNTMMMGDVSSGEYLWGYGVSDHQYSGSSSRNPLTLVKHVKSKLLHSKYTEDDRISLQPIFAELLREGLIRRLGTPLISGHEPDHDPRDAQDVLTDFFTKVFQHTKKELVLHHGFSSLWKIRLVMTVPVPKLWSQQSSWILQSSMEAALLAADFAGSNNVNLEDIVIISEPEAAAFYLMAATDCAMVAGESFLVIDAGGGTTDATIYTVSTEYPLTLRREAVEPTGDNCGGSYLNENFRSLLCDRLKDETYLFRHGETLQTIVDRHIPAFENKWKRLVDLSTGRCDPLYVAGLRKDPVKWFNDNTVIMTNNHYATIFRSNLDRNVAVADNQMALAAEKGILVKKIFLVGGYGESPALRRRLRSHFKQLSKKLQYEIEFITDKKYSGLAVSAGAVLRGHNIEAGPDRIVQSSFGFLRTEHYLPPYLDKKKRRMLDEDGRPLGYEGHNEARPWTDKVDGERYVRTLVYFIVKGEDVPTHKRFGPFPTYHTFKATASKLICREEIYACDTTGESHYTRTNQRNRGCQLIGAIEVDMTFLKEKGLKPIWPAQGKPSCKYYRVEYELYAIVDGLKLRYEAKWPIGEQAQIRESGQISIAAAFNFKSGAK